MRKMFEKYMEEFLKSIDQESNYADNTINTYRNRLSPFFNWLSDNTNYRSMTSITKHDLRAFLETINHNSANTVNLTINACTSMWKWMAEEDIVTINITTGVRRPKIKTQAVKFLTVNEAINMIKESENYGARDEIVNKRIELTVKMLLLTGLRVSELVNIKEEDIRGDILTITNGKGGKPATLSLHAEVLRVIDEYKQMKLNKGYKCEYLFVANGDKQITIRTVANSVTELMARVGRPDLSTHKTRSTYAIMKLIEGEDLLTVQKLLRHSDPKTTMRYVDAIDEKKIMANKKSILIG